jgi:hypothetical protein
VVFTDFTLRSVFKANSHLVKVVSVKFATRMQLLCETTKQTVNLSVHQDGRCPRTRIKEILETKLSSLNSQCHAIRNKNPEAATVVQQVHKMLSGIEILAECAPAEVEESSLWHMHSNAE